MFFAPLRARLTHTFDIPRALAISFMLTRSRELERLFCLISQIREKYFCDKKAIGMLKLLHAGVDSKKFLSLWCLCKCIAVLQCRPHRISPAIKISAASFFLKSFLVRYLVEEVFWLIILVLKWLEIFLFRCLSFQQDKYRL